MPDPFEIIRDDDGSQHAIGRQVSLTVLPDKAQVCRIFWRNRMKPFAKPAKHERILVAQLDDVRLYITNGNELVLTKKDFA